MSPFFWGLVAGIIIGGAAGFFCCALLVCSREDRFWEKTIKGRKKDA